MPRRWSRWDWFAPLICALWMAACSLPWMGRLGMEFDEAHFLEPAARIAFGHPMKIEQPVGIYLDGRPFPFMTMPYVGGLDAWLMAIPMRLLGPGPMAMRSVHLFAGWVVVALAYFAAWRFGGRAAAWMAAGLLLADLEFLVHVPVHFGPFLIQMICAVVIVLAIERWFEDGRARFFYAACFAAGIAFQEKLTFLWVLLPLIVAYVVCRWREVRARLSIAQFVIGLVVMLAAMLPVLIYVYGFHEQILAFGRASVAPAEPLTWRLWAKAAAFHDLLTGQEFFKQQLGATGVTRVSALALLYVAALVVSAVRRDRVVLPWLLLPVAVTGINAMLQDGGRPHHLILAYPLMQIGMAVALARIRFTAILAAVLLAGTLLSTALCLRWYTAEIARTGGRGHWSAAIYELARWADEETRRHPETQFFTSSWGLSRQVYALTRGRVEMKDYFLPLSNDPVEAETAEAVRGWTSRRFTYLLASGIGIYEQNNAKALVMARQAGREPRLMREFPAGPYRVYSFGPEENGNAWTAIQPAAESEVAHVTFALPPGTKDVRFRVAGPWEGVDALAVELQDENRERLISWWRSLEFYLPPKQDQPLTFGFDLSPADFGEVKNPARRAGEPRFVRVFPLGKPRRPVAVHTLEIRLR